ncbi:hypothetical protein ACHAXT_013095 [Thalassiosira profunda]
MPQDRLSDIDLTPIIESLCAAIVCFPFVLLALDLALDRRTTLRDLLVVYKGIVLAGFVAFPTWYYLIEHGHPCGILVLASLFAGLGIAWWTIVTSKNYPKRLPQRSKEKEIFC